MQGEEDERTPTDAAWTGATRSAARRRGAARAGAALFALSVFAAAVLMLGMGRRVPPPAAAHPDSATVAGAPSRRAHPTLASGEARASDADIPTLAAPAGPPRELVVLVHGLGRTEFSMLLLAWSLEHNGYDVLNWGYSSLCCTIEELGRKLSAELAAVRAADGTPTPRRVHLVGHSLGNIIIRWLVARQPDDGWGNVVMLAPPNQGAHSADAHVRWLAWLLRPLPEIVTTAGSTARSLPWPAHVPAGVIAGRYDGKVAVEETHLDGETAHVVVPAMHSFIMNRADVRRLTLEFLRDGRFGS